MTTVYFISAFLMLNATPPLGWIQWTQDYSDMSSCQEVIKLQKDEMRVAIRAQFGKKVIKILDWECLPHQEAVDRNSKLGH